MAQACSLSSSTVDVNGLYNNKRLPKGIHIVGAEEKYGIYFTVHLNENLDVFDFTLNDNDMQIINSKNQNKSFFGWD